MYQPEVQIKGNSYISNLHIFYSAKIQRCINCWSDLEYYNCLLLECNPKVLEYCEQRPTVKGKYDGKIVKTRFDMHVIYIDGREEYQEVKYSDCFDEGHKSYKNTIKQTSVQREWCKNNNKIYTIRTEKEIMSNLFLINNLKKIYFFVRQKKKISLENTKKIIKYLEEGPKKIYDIVNFIGIPSSVAYTIIFALIYTGNCNTKDLSNKMIDFYTEVYLECPDVALRMR